MTDEVIEELWRIKDGIASEHGHDVRRLAAHLQSRRPAPRDPTVDGRAVHEMVDKDKTVGTAAEGLS